MIIIKRKEGAEFLTWISNPSIRRAFPAEQSVFELTEEEMSGWVYIERFFEIIDTPGTDREDITFPAP